MLGTPCPWRQADISLAQKALGADVEGNSNVIELLINIISKSIGHLVEALLSAG